jgi:hypothetical protein
VGYNIAIPHRRAKPMPTNPVALEFARFVLQSQSPDTDFAVLYDAMSRAAAGRQFRDLGCEELARVGVSFSLLATGKLELLVEEARRTLTTLTKPNDCSTLRPTSKR